jgi:hypothetical protein
MKSDDEIIRLAEKERDDFINSRLDSTQKITISELQEEVKDMKSATTPKVPIITAKQLVDTDYPETTWLVKDLIPSIGFTALTGAPASYKSWITEHLAICVATGTPLFNHFEVTQGAVLMIDKENSPNLLKDRLLKLGIKEDPEIYFLEDPDHYSLQDPDTLAETVEIVKKLKIKLLVLDSFAHIHKGDENDSMAIVATFEKLKQITKLGCAIVFIHHHRKTIKMFTATALETIRGSSDIAAELESHLALDAIKEKIRVSQNKNRWGTLFPPFMIQPIIGEEAALFEYAGILEEAVSKSEEAEQMILSTLVQAKEVSRKAFMSLFEGAVSGRTLVQKLKDLEDSGTIIGTMRDRQKYYVLSQKGEVQSQMQIAFVEDSSSEQPNQ